MRLFEVVALSVGGRGNRIHNSGAIVREDLFLPNTVDSLVQKGSIRELFAAESTVNEAPERFKVAIITAMWKRPEVFKVFGQLTNDLIESVSEVDFCVFCVGSEGEMSRKLAESFGFTYIEHPNDNLSEKWGACVERASKWSPHYYLMMGSDDVMDAALFRRYLPYMHNGIDLIGVLDWYFYDMVSGDAIYWKGYRQAHNRGMTCGAGRMISRALIDQMRLNPWRGNRRNKGLDTTMENNLRSVTHSRAAFIMGDGTNGLGVDLKSDTNINAFKEWDNCTRIDPTMIQMAFTPLIG